MTHSGRDSSLNVVYGLILEEITEPPFKMFEGLLFMCEEQHFHLWKYLVENKGLPFRSAVDVQD